MYKASFRRCLLTFYLLHQSNNLLQTPAQHPLCRATSLINNSPFIHSNPNLWSRQYQSYRFYIKNNYISVQLLFSCCIKGCNSYICHQMPEMTRLNLKLFDFIIAKGGGLVTAVFVCLFVYLSINTITQKLKINGQCPSGNWNIIKIL